MSAYGQVDFTTGADTTAAKLCASFQAPYGTAGFAMRFCSRVHKLSGEGPGYAFAAMPCRSFPADEDSVNHPLALSAAAFASQVLLNTRAQIAYAEANGATVNLQVGTLVTYNHDVKEDSIIAEIADDRWVLSKITVFGRSVYDPSSGVYYFDATSPCIFNKFGYPDCIDSPFGPVFAPSYRYGWNAGQGDETTTEPDPGYATTKARKWRVEDAFEYLCNQHGFIAKRPLSPVDYGVQTLPNYIQWRKEIGHFVGSNRPLNDVNMDNKSLLGALQDLARHGGAYDLDVEPAGDFRSNLCLRNMNPLTGLTGTPLYLAGYEGSASIATKMQGADWIESGNVRESIVNRFPHTVIVGDPVSCERFCTSLQADSTFTVAGVPTIEKAYSAATHTAAKAYVAAHLTDADQNSQSMAFLQFPDWLCAFRTGRGVDLFSGTKWAGTPLGARYARIHPSQLTAYSTGGSANPANWLTKQIVVELHMSPDEITAYNAAADAAIPPYAHTQGWREASRYDNLSLNPDSTIIFLDNLRNSGSFPCFYNIPAGEQYVQRDIRIQLAVQSTWALTGSDKTDYNRTARRINPQGPQWTYLTVSKPGDYVEFLRAAASRPNGQIISEPYRTTDFPTKAAAGSELYTDRPGAINNPDAAGRIVSHAACRQQDVNRIDYSGQLVIARLSPAMRPGLPINIVGNNLIPVFAIVKSVTFISQPGVIQSTIVEFGPPDSREIYDAPGVYATHSGSGAYTMDNPTYRQNKGGYDESGGGKTVTETKTYESFERPYDQGGGTGQREVTTRTETQTPEWKRSSSWSEGARGDSGSHGDAYYAREEKKAARDERGAEKAQGAVENRQNQAADKAAQRSNHGGMVGGSGFFGFGKGGSGRMTVQDSDGKGGTRSRDITDLAKSGLGYGGAGRMEFGNKNFNAGKLQNLALRNQNGSGGHQEFGIGKTDPRMASKFNGKFFDGRGAQPASPTKPDGAGAQLGSAWSMQRSRVYSREQSAAASKEELRKKTDRAGMMDE